LVSGEKTIEKVVQSTENKGTKKGKGLLRFEGRIGDCNTRVETRYTKLKKQRGGFLFWSGRRQRLQNRGRGP